MGPSSWSAGWTRLFEGSGGGHRVAVQLPLCPRALEQAPGRLAQSALGTHTEGLPGRHWPPPAPSRPSPGARAPLPQHSTATQVPCLTQSVSDTHRPRPAQVARPSSPACRGSDSPLPRVQPVSRSAPGAPGFWPQTRAPEVGSTAGTYFVKAPPPLSKWLFPGIFYAEEGEFIVAIIFS